MPQQYQPLNIDRGQLTEENEWVTLSRGEAGRNRPLESLPLNGTKLVVLQRQVWCMNILSLLDVNIPKADFFGQTLRRLIRYKTQ
ncbi:MULTISPECIES: hypothetical protein [Pseudomonas]|uniref:hypothetical protein n=1 Tax=Pseudomonas TaxID=286 RepID=UPI0011B0AD9A|nr:MULTISPECIES: hypothetical protein [Pseudomonas]QXN51332.1 hypothetical protein KW062_06125 [Pseudomonas fluorescens]WSO25650.1 hypothetical protein VUJ50_06135 [Pseudomonas fluorescens]